MASVLCFAAATLPPVQAPRPRNRPSARPAGPRPYTWQGPQRISGSACHPRSLPRMRGCSLQTICTVHADPGWWRVLCRNRKNGGITPLSVRPRPGLTDCHCPTALSGEDRDHSRGGMGGPLFAIGSGRPQVHTAPANKPPGILAPGNPPYTGTHRDPRRPGCVAADERSRGPGHAPGGQGSLPESWSEGSAVAVAFLGAGATFAVSLRSSVARLGSVGCP